MSLKGDLLDRRSFERFVELGIFRARRRIGRSCHLLVNGSAEVLAVVFLQSPLTAEPEPALRSALKFNYARLLLAHKIEGLLVNFLKAERVLQGILCVYLIYG